MTPVTFPDDVPVLSDGVVTLRAHTPADAEGVREQCVDPVSIRWTTVPLRYTLDDALSFVTTRVPAAWDEGHTVLAVEATDDTGRARFCGTVELRDEGGDRAEIAYGAHPWARGRGIMHRALELLLAYGFDELGLRSVVWWAHRGNWASRRTAWRLGFTCDGTVERWLSQRGELVDAWVGVLHPDDERAPRTDWLEVPRLEADGLVLRAPRPSDAERVVTACQDERTAYWLARMPSPYTLADAHDYLESRIEQQATTAGLTWFLADPVTDDLLGALSLFDLKPGRDAEMGYWTHPDARGKGVMTRAARTVLRHALTPADRGGMGLVRVQVSHADGNDASRHVIEQCGFTSTGRERRALRLRDDRLVDCLTYDLLAEELS
jgi:RimJ/RimL family protein N-acetyltransferase